jgi:hypothetical protein
MEILTKLFLAYRGISSPLNLGQYFFLKLKAKLKPNKMEELYQLIKIGHEHNILTCH